MEHTAIIPNMTFSDGAQLTVSLSATDQDLIITPDVKTGVWHLFNTFVMRDTKIWMFDDDQVTIIVGSFSMHINHATKTHEIRWSNEKPPITFFEVQRVWNRLMKLKAFW